MNFEYEKGGEPLKIPVAFIAEDGNLVIRAEDDYYDDGNAIYVVLNTSSNTVDIEREEYDTEYSPLNETNKKLFYSGDKITITF